VPLQRSGGGGCTAAPGDAVAPWFGAGGGTGSRQRSQSFGIFAAVCTRPLIFPGEHPGENRAVITAPWFVAAGHVSGRERKTPRVEV